MKLFFSTLFFLFIVLLLVCPGCSFNADVQKPRITPYQSYIARSRFQTIQGAGKFICLIDQERQPALETVQNIIKIAEQSALSVEFRNIPGSLRIPALLRAGKGDLAIGNYKAEDGIEKQLDVVKIGNAVCLLRQNDSDWKTILIQGASLIAEVAPNKKETVPPQMMKQSMKK